MMPQIEGPKGSGKSYGAQAVALARVLFQGRHVWVNWDVDYTVLDDATLKRWSPYLWEGRAHALKILADNTTRFYGFEELEDAWRAERSLPLCRDAVVIYDEAHKQVGARDWEKMSPELKNLMAESRKDRLHLILITQVWKNLDVWARRLADEVWSTHRFLCWTIWIKAEDFDAETGEYRGWKDFRIFRRPWRELEEAHPFIGLMNLWELSKKVPGLYDSMRKIEVRHHAKKKPYRSGAPTGPPREPQGELPW